MGAGLAGAGLAGGGAGCAEAVDEKARAVAKIATTIRIPDDKGNIKFTGK
jgi:hypothetical protein